MNNVIGKPAKSQKVRELPRFSVTNLMQGHKRMHLRHAGKDYLLSITKRGKLILTAA